MKTETHPTKSEQKQASENSEAINKESAQKSEAKESLVRADNIDLKRRKNDNKFTHLTRSYGE